MNSNFARAFAFGLVAVVVAVGAILFMQRGAHMVLPGTMKVRIVPTGDNDALAVVDLHVSNPADYGFEVHNVTVTLVTSAGEFPQGIVSRTDAQRLFESKPEAGPFHPTLYTNAVIPAHTTADYTLVAQFSAPERILQDRKRFVVRFDEINGKSIEFAEK